MSAIATIPTISEYRELLLSPGDADFVYGFAVLGDYLYATTKGASPKIVKINKANFSDYTIAALPGTGNYTFLVSANSKLYALSPNGSKISIVEITPATLASSEVIADSTNASQVSAFDGLTTDGTYLYVLATVDGTPSVVRYAVVGFARTDLELTGYTVGNSIKAIGGSVYLTGVHSSAPATRRMVKVTNMAIESTGNIPTPVSGADFIAGLSADIYAGFEDNPGYIFKFDSAMNVSTGIMDASAEHAAIQSDGTYLWDLLENGQAIRISASGDERIYTLNAGQGFITDIAGDGQYLYASWFQSGSKFSRYKIGATGGSLHWVQTVTTGLPDYTLGVACDSNGNVIAGGSQQNNASAWLNKYTPAGGVIWSKGAIVAGATVGVVVDSSDNVYACGWSQGTGTTGSANVFVHKYLANGDTSWQKLFTGPSDEKGYGIVIDPSGDVIICGTFDAAIDIGGTLLSSAGGYDMFVAKLSAVDGSTIWAKRFGGTTNPGVDVANAIACDPSGNIYVAGQFDVSIDFGNGTGTLTGTGSEGFLVKLNSSGDAQWSKRFGGTLNDASYGVATFSNGDVVVTGGWRNTTDFGFGNVTSTGFHDIFIAKYSTAGTPIWVKTFGGGMGLSDYAYDAAVDDDDNLVVGGAASGNIDFGGGAETMNGLDCWIAKYRSNGDFVWSKAFGNATFPDRCQAVAVDLFGNVIAGGFFYGEVDFGGEIRHYPQSGGDAFVAKYSA